MRVAVLSFVALWAGMTLLLTHVRWFARRPLVERLQPYSPTLDRGRPRGTVLSVDSFRDVIGPIVNTLGSRLGALFGVDEDVTTRLERVHSPLDASAFRLRQFGATAAGLVVGLVASVALRLPAAFAVLCIVGLPLLAFLLVEQQLANESANWQRGIFLELPVVAEQLGMLLAAGYSLGTALNRLAARGKGKCGRDLPRVCGRIRHGLTEVEALREWAELERVEALDRLVALLRLNRDAGDLGRLISEEARSIRRDVHRQLIETIERRGQQVWIPVTVATLVPGVIFLAIPFTEAMRLFTQS